MTEEPTGTAADHDPGGLAAATGAGSARARRALRLIRSGEDPETGFRILFASYYRPLLRFFARKGMAPADAADLTQETFLGIYRGLKDLRRVSRFEPWLYRIATTAYLKSLRHGSAAKRAGIEIPHDETPMAHPASMRPAEQLDDVLLDERRQELRQAIRELPDQMRRCLTLRVYQDRTYREIAVLMRIRIDTVKAHLHQARSRLRERLSARSLEPLGGPDGSAR